MKSERDLRPLVDGDPVVYRAGFSADSQIKKQLKEEFPGINDDELKERMMEKDYLPYALGNVKTFLEMVTSRFSPDYKLYLHGGGNFRDDIATIQPYKGNRDRNHVPKYKKEIIEYMGDVWKAEFVQGMESDDAICIEQHKNTDKNTVIVSIDKDILQGMYGWNYNPMRDELKFTTPTQANNFFFWQMMVGDSSDNIKGINKVGEKRASEVLAACDNDTNKIREAVKDMYRKQYGEDWERCYTETGTLLWILKKPEELTTGCPLLW